MLICMKNLAIKREMVNKENLRVAQINSVYNIASTGRNVAELHESLVNAGHDSYVIYSQTNVPTPQKSYRMGNKLDIKVHGFLSRLFGKQGYFSFTSTKRMLKYLDKVKPDIVHLNNLHANYINVPLVLKYLAKNDIATVVTLHDFWCITGNCVYPNLENCVKWQKQCENCPNINNGNRSWFFDRTNEMHKDKIRLFNNIPRLALIGVSQWVANEAKMSPISNKALVKHIYNWIDFDKFYPRDVEEIKKQENPQNKFTVLSAAMIWDPKKGLEKYIELAKQKKDYNFVLIGRIPPDTVLPSNVNYVGAISSMDKLAEYYSMADVFVTFSTAETFGKVSAEAMSCGTPVICNNTTACPEILGDGCGCAVEIGNVQAFVDAIDEVYNKGKAYYSDNCIDFTRKHFNKETLINEYIEVYKKLSL